MENQFAAGDRSNCLKSGWRGADSFSAEIREAGDEALSLVAALDAKLFVVPMNCSGKRPY